MILSDHEATRRKENKETINDHSLPVSLMLWNSLEDSREFYFTGDGYKTCSLSKSWGV